MQLDHIESQTIQQTTEVPQQEKFNLLLLGPKFAGKSVIYNQIHNLLGNKSSYDPESMITSIHGNVITTLKALAKNCTKYGKISSEHMVTAQNLVELQQLEKTTIVPAQVRAYMQFWADPVVQKTWENRALYSDMYDCAEFFMSKLDEITAPDYIPSKSCLNNVYVSSRDVSGADFTINSREVQFIDIGGQRDQRRFWSESLQSASVLIFVASISDYDQCLYEYEHTNRLSESLHLFESVCNSKYVKDIPIVLVLNKVDLFEEKIQTTPMKAIFPLYSGDESAESTKQWIVSQFKSFYRGNPDLLQVKLISATDISSVQPVLDSVVHLVNCCRTAK